MELPVKEGLRRLAARFREAAEAAGTQAEVAALIGCHPSTMKRYVSGRTRPTDRAVEVVANASKYTVEWILTGHGPRHLTDSIEQTREADPGPTEDEAIRFLRRRFLAACEAAGVAVAEDDSDLAAMISATVDIVFGYAPERRVEAMLTVTSAQHLAVLFVRQATIRRSMLQATRGRVD